MIPTKKMLYCSLKYSGSDNLGDEIQSLAAEQYLPTIDGFFERDTGLHSVSEPTCVILNGWFKHSPTHWRDDAADCWPPSNSVRPVFVRLHIAFPDLLTDSFVEYYRRWMAIGCRDKGSMQLLQDRGLEAYFSRCLTLTFPHRTEDPAEGKVYIVEGNHPVDKARIPKELLKDAVFRRHDISADRVGHSEWKRQTAAVLLHEYKTNARLVVTDLLHCAMPCVAMHITVVFLAPQNPDEHTPYRLAPVYATGDEIDWNPIPKDVSRITSEIRLKTKALVP